MSREFTHTDGSALPVWLGKKEKINEPLFCEELLKDKLKTDGTLILELRYVCGLITYI